MTPKNKAETLAIAVVEDDPRVRSSLVGMIRQNPGCVCGGDYASGEEAVAGLVKHPARVVIMDIHLPGIDGVECVRQLSPVLPDTQFLMLTVAKDSDNLFNALAAGAGGYLLKPVRAGELLDAIRDVDQGGAPMTSSIARRVVAAFHRKPAPPTGEALTEREQEVLKRLAEGLLYKQAAAEMGVSVNTLREYIRRIYKKLQVHSRQQAIDHHRRRG
ncbi:MAG: response regulator transcription factor [Verrucomicrobia bacterium]|nr:response regulator transcription factor [Verrucomicrobiota bacterium]